MNQRTRGTAIVGALSASLTLSACGGGDTSAAPQGGNAPASAPSSQMSKEHYGADVQFARDMIVHHQQAVVMADLAATLAQNPEVKVLADKIRVAQQPEIDTMTGWLREWDQPVAPSDMGGMDHGAMDMGDMEMDTSGLEAAAGTEFDRMFLEMMTEHHRGAIEMAEQVLREGENPRVADLARHIIDTQRAEIDQMTAWRQQWSTT